MRQVLACICLRLLLWGAHACRPSCFLKVQWLTRSCWGQAHGYLRAPLSNNAVSAPIRLDRLERLVALPERAA